MPLIGFEELPKRPLMRAATVTKRKPNTVTKIPCEEIVIPARLGALNGMEGEENPDQSDDDE